MTTESHPLGPYDALLLVSFGGPEQAADVMPFLRNVTRGRGVPEARLEEVAQHYLALGGKSPINDQNRALISAIAADFQRHGHEVPIYFGNRNWHPFLADTLREMAQAGVGRALAFVTSAFSSYSGCRQYREDIERARGEVSGAPQVDVLRRFFNHPGFAQANLEHIQNAWSELSEDLRDDARLVFTAHSIPGSMASSCDYERQLRDVGAWIAQALGRSAWDLVWQSRSGPPEVPWLEPDILQHLRDLRSAGTRAVVVSPLGFTTDHMEVVYDLDHEAQKLCAELGLTMKRARTASTHPSFVAMIRELALERSFGGPVRSIGTLPPRPNECPRDCCPAPLRRPGPPATGPDKSP